MSEWLLNICRRCPAWLTVSYVKPKNVGWFWRVLTMVYNVRDYWVSGLCPSSGILRNTTFPKLDMSPKCCALEYSTADKIKKKKKKKSRPKNSHVLRGKGTTALLTTMTMIIFWNVRNTVRPCKSSWTFRRSVLLLSSGFNNQVELVRHAAWNGDSSSLFLWCRCCDKNIS
jgi:hypothetical protein